MNIIFFLSPCDGIHCIVRAMERMGAQTRPRFILLSENVSGEWR